MPSNKPLFTRPSASTLRLPRIRSIFCASIPRSPPKACPGTCTLTASQLLLARVVSNNLGGFVVTFRSPKFSSLVESHSFGASLCRSRGGGFSATAGCSPEQEENSHGAQLRRQARCSSAWAEIPDRRHSARRKLYGCRERFGTRRRHDLRRRRQK